MKNLKTILKNTLICGACAYTILEGGTKLFNYMVEKKYPVYNNTVTMVERNGSRELFIQHESDRELVNTTFNRIGNITLEGKTEFVYINRDTRKVK